MFNSVDNGTQLSTTVHPRKPTDAQVDSWISDTVGALCDPIICHRGQLDRPPEDFRQAISLQRLIENIVAIREQRQPIASDAEACWYLSTASLEAMFSHDWYEIYMYVFNQTMQFMKKEIPEDLRFDKIDNMQMNDLNDLKRWIYAKRAEARKGAAVAERREKRDAAKQAKQDEKDLMAPMF